MPRHTSLGPDSFDSVWGYCAVVGTRELLWSGHRIPEPASLSELDDYVAALSDGLALASPLSAKVFPDGAVSWLAGEPVEASHRQGNDGEDPRAAALSWHAPSRGAGAGCLMVMRRCAEGR